MSRSPDGDRRDGDRRGCGQRCTGRGAMVPEGRIPLLLPAGRIIKEPVRSLVGPSTLCRRHCRSASASGRAHRLTGNRRLADRLLRRRRGDGVSPALLISDLGRPERFLTC